MYQNETMHNLKQQPGKLFSSRIKLFCIHDSLQRGRKEEKQIKEKDESHCISANN